MNILKPSFTWLGAEPEGLAILDNIARAAHVCYQSEGVTSNADFLRSVIKRGHDSVLEHEKISVIVTCDRGVTHEIVRHRIASYSQESTRYCNYGDTGGVNFIDINEGIKRDPKCKKLSGLDRALIYKEWLEAMEDAERHYLKMLKLGASPQIARSVLPNSTRTQIVMTMNIREWRHFFKLRAEKHAHPQMIEVANMLLEAFKDVVPVVFDDLEPCESGT